MPLAVNTAHSGDPVRAFVETIVFEAGFSHLDDEAKAGLVAALLEEARKRIGLEMLKAVDKDSAAAFRALREEGADEDEIAAFFRVRLPDADALVRKSLSDFGVECLKIARDLGTSRPIRL